ncbi:MAG: metalloprotease PmbA [Gammaproteobacteria bacterium]|nr:metalloprotease PmbA [Gammaproteobacteria bacterium]
MVAEFNPELEKSRLSERVEWILSTAKRQGAEACEVAASSQLGLDVQARMGQVEKLELTRDQSVSVTVFVGQARGSATTTDLSEDALTRSVEAALAMARVTAPDPAAILASPDQMIRTVPDLALDHPWALTPDQALALAISAEAAGLAVDARLTNSEGASVSSTRGVSVHGTSEGLLVGQSSSLHGLSCVLIAEDGDSRERHYAYTHDRNPALLVDAEEIGRDAARKTLDRLHARQCQTGEVPVLFTADVASGLLSHLFSAIGGNALYRKASYLVDRLGTQVMPSWVTIAEDPLLLGAIGSSAYDGDGLPTRQQTFIEDGRLVQYVLSLYSAHRLGMQSTHNAGGVRNVRFSGETDWPALVRQMERGLIVTDLMGQGVNLVTGDYSRGASGFWVEGGEIQYPVHEVTVAGHLDQLFQHHLVAVGSDVDTRKSLASGSLLFDRMMVAGESA